jgi:hypothetical protein
MSKQGAPPNSHVDPRLAHLIGDDPRRQRVAELEAQKQAEKEQKEAREKWLAMYDIRTCTMITVPLNGAVYYCHDNRDPVAQKNHKLQSWPGSVGLRYSRLYSAIPKVSGPAVDINGFAPEEIRVHNDVDFMGCGVISELVNKPSWWDKVVERELKNDADREESKLKKTS